MPANKTRGRSILSVEVELGSTVPEGFATVFTVLSPDRLEHFTRFDFEGETKVFTTEIESTIEMASIQIELSVRVDKPVRCAFYARLSIARGDEFLSEDRMWSGWLEFGPWTIVTLNAAKSVTKNGKGASELLSESKASENYRNAGLQRKPKTEHAVVPVLFGTNRRLISKGTASVRFGDRDWNNALNLGVADVCIPASHRLGSTGSSLLWRVLTLTDDRLKLRSTRMVDRAEFSRICAQGENRVFVFVHGYNVGFESALYRAAQIAHDTNFPGTIAVFAWPSADAAKNYVEDSNSVGVSESPLAEFLVLLKKSRPSADIHIIAHSMGSRAVLGALRNLRIDHSGLGKLGHLVFAASDVDRQKFGDDFKQVLPTVSSATLYCSDKDRALGASEWLGSYPRAGRTPPVTSANGLHTVNCAGIDPSFLGHSYFASCRPLLLDLAKLLSTGIADPVQRGLKTNSKVVENPVWEISASE